MIGFKRFVTLQVYKALRLMKGAEIVITNDDGTESVLDMSEFEKLNDLTATAAELNTLDGITASTAELNIMDGVTATAAEINNAADVSARTQGLTASGAVTAGVQAVELAHGTVAIAATIADAANHQGLFVVKNTSASGTEAHTLTLTAGTFDGTNDVATLNAPGETLVVYFDSAGNGVVVENIGEVGLS